MRVVTIGCDEPGLYDKARLMVLNQRNYPIRYVVARMTPRAEPLPMTSRAQRHAAYLCLSLFVVLPMAGLLAMQIWRAL